MERESEDRTGGEGKGWENEGVGNKLLPVTDDIRTCFANV